MQFFFKHLVLSCSLLQPKSQLNILMYADLYTCALKYSATFSVGNIYKKNTRVICVTGYLPVWRWGRTRFSVENLNNNKDNNCRQKTLSPQTYPEKINTTELPKSIRNTFSNATSHTLYLIGPQGFFLWFLLSTGISSVIVPRHHIPVSLLLMKVLAPIWKQIQKD